MKDVVMKNTFWIGLQPSLPEAALEYTCTKIENYFVQDMQQEFLKPSKEDNPRYIYRIDNKIQLQAKVRSGKVLGTFERTTKGGGTTVIIREGMDSYDTEFVPLPSSVEYINILKEQPKAAEQQ
jgi:hypothetical protein